MFALHDALTADTGTAAVPDVLAWRARWRSHLAPETAAGTPFSVALRGGFEADRMAWAMTAGYQAALRALLPGRLAPDEVAAFCMTEPGGNRPRDLRAAVVRTADGGWQVDGHKRWITLGPACDTCLVVAVDVAETQARASSGHGLPALRLVRVPAGSVGVQQQAMPATPFVPEVPHAEVLFTAVQVPADALLPGDGWSDHGKPFRAREDTLVTTAVLAYLLREARARAWPQTFQQRTLAVLQALQAVAARDVHALDAQLVLAGALDWAHQLFAEAGGLWQAQPDDPTAQRWARDLGLLNVAGRARHQRAARAWERLAPARA